MLAHKHISTSSSHKVIAIAQFLYVYSHNRIVDTSIPFEYPILKTGYICDKKVIQKTARKHFYNFTINVIFNFNQLAHFCNQIP